MSNTREYPGSQAAIHGSFLLLELLITRPSPLSTIKWNGARNNGVSITHNNKSLAGPLLALNARRDILNLCQKVETLVALLLVPRGISDYLYSRNRE